MRPRIVLIAALLLAVVIGVAAYARRTPPQTQTVTFEASATPTPTKQVFTCAGVTKKGERCKRHVTKQGDYCWQHKAQQHK